MVFIFQPDKLLFCETLKDFMDGLSILDTGCFA